MTRQRTFTLAGVSMSKLHIELAFFQQTKVGLSDLGSTTMWDQIYCNDSYEFGHI